MLGLYYFIRAWSVVLITMWASGGRAVLAPCAQAVIYLTKKRCLSRQQKRHFIGHLLCVVLYCALVVMDGYWSEKPPI